MEVIEIPLFQDENKTEVDPLPYIDHPHVRGLRMSHSSAYLPVSTQKSILKHIYNNKWITVSKTRRQQHYGFIFDYKTLNIVKVGKVQPIPKWANDVFSYLITIGFIDKRPTQLTVTEHCSEDRLGARIEGPNAGHEIIIITLGSVGEMLFRRAREQQKVYTVPGFIMTIKGDAKQCWTYERLPMSAGTSVSLTFRHI